MTRKCDAFKCPEKVVSGRFLCIRHWRMVPLETQRTINSRYRACRDSFGFLSDIAYLQACVEAIDGIARAEGKDVQPTTYHRMLASEKRKAEAKGLPAEAR